MINSLILAAKIFDYAKDPNPDNWRTVNGARIHIDENGEVDGGAGAKFNNKKFGEDWRAGQRSALMQAAGVYQQPEEKKWEIPKLKGSEKQVKWANDIIQEAVDTIEANLKRSRERAKQYPKDTTFSDNVAIWEKLDKAYKALFPARIDNAAEIIDKRNYLNGRGMVEKFNKLSAVAQSGVKKQ